ncbi:superoxide dismutase [Actinokineospora sp. HUAS TT18]|uniref:superoxide dismutase n=1 Tax=Actinokineospora sp. HUAS TT18 TaxID=3447451 RepID=UPI003F51DFD2
MPARALPMLAAVALLSACGQSTSPAADGSPTSEAKPTVALRGGGTFAAFAPGTTAITYNPALLPGGASAEVVVSTTAEGVRTELKVTGLLPSRTYGAHAHVKPCGEKGDAAGPHFQHKADPVTPSVDPAFANDDNEIWLDVTTDAHGAGSSTSTVDWGIADRRPASVVLHETATHAHAGQAGTAGARLGCLTLASPA